ncbi:phage protease [Terasakiella pusilla]|uniref:phage protease n=1 Tax=Terasakiella pusilla TaxID=64973 RepID=UPI003AA88906
MSRASHIAMMAAQDLPSPPDGAEVPEWIQLTPAGRFETFDARGPYEVTDPQAVIEASFAARGEIEIDVNHASFTAAKAGGEAPARGWIVEMQSRDDGIWGKVRWTKEGARLVADQAYRRISPVFRLAHPGSNRVVAILNASLVNRQNLRGLAALNFEEEERMSFLKQLAGVLDLGADATEEQVTTAVNKLKEDGDGATAAQSQLDEVATILGVDAGGDVVAAAKATAAGGLPVSAMQAAVTEMQETIAAQAEQINSMQKATAKERAEAFVYGEIKRGRFVQPQLRDHYIAMHQEDPARIEKEISAMPMLNGGSVAHLTPPSTDGSIAMNAEQSQAAKLLGLSAEEYQAVLDEERKAQEGF